MGKTGRVAWGPQVYLIKGQCGLWCVNNHRRWETEEEHSCISSPLCALSGQHIFEGLSAQWCKRQGFAHWCPSLLSDPSVWGKSHFSWQCLKLKSKDMHNYVTPDYPSKFLPFLGVQPAIIILIAAFPQVFEGHTRLCSCDASGHYSLQLQTWEVIASRTRRVTRLSTQSLGNGWA